MHLGTPGQRGSAGDKGDRGDTGSQGYPGNVGPAGAPVSFRKFDFSFQESLFLFTIGC